MSGFTKGPWVIIPSGDEWGRGRVGTIEPKPGTMLETNYWTVAECNNRRDECMANAKLIAASPLMIDALQKIRFRCECFLEDERSMSLSSIEAIKAVCDEVISKAI